MILQPQNVIPNDIDALKAALIAARIHAADVESKFAIVSGERDVVVSELAIERAQRSDDQALIAHMKLLIAKMKREKFGPRSEKSQRLLDQMELHLEDLEASATEDELAAEKAAAQTTNVKAFARKRPARKPFPEHLPRERMVVPGPTSCSCCGGTRLVKLGEDVTETLDVVPRTWKVIQTVREKFSCRDCETIDQAPAPFHATPRGFAGPSLLAMIIFEKYGQHQPLNRQSERYAREGVDLSLSTLADQVGACTFALAPLTQRLEAHVFAAERLHGDDTTVPVLAKGQTVTGRLWTYVRDDRPFGGQAPPAAMFYYSRDRRQEHPEEHLINYMGILQADAYGGYNPVFAIDRQPKPLIAAYCWAHARREFFELADIEAAARKMAKGKTDVVVSPLAIEAVRRIDELFMIERDLNGLPTEQRQIVRQERSAPLLISLEAWMQEKYPTLSQHSDIAKAMNYMLKRWDGFARFIDDGRICLTNNAAERALRGIALGRKSWLFCGSDRGGQRAAAMYSLIVTAKMNDIDPQAWLADVLARLPSHPAHRIDELLPWNWKKTIILPQKKSEILVCASILENENGSATGV
jgi:transposase